MKANAKIPVCFHDDFLTLNENIPSMYGQDDKGE